MFSRVYSSPLVLTSFLLVLCTSSYAQVTIRALQKASPVYNEWGTILGGNFQQLSASPFVAKYSTGLTAGFYFRHNTRYSSVELGLTSASARFTAEATDQFERQDLDVAFFNVPFVASVKTSKRWRLQMGATYQFLISATNKTTPKSSLFEDNKLFRRSNLQLTVGVEYALDQDMLLGASYGIGMLDINNQKYGSYTETWMTSGAQVTLKSRVRKIYKKIK
jgi:hypothetical protein